MQRPNAAALVLWWSLASVALAGAQTLPRPTSKVNDVAGVLTPAARATLESLLTQLEKDTSAAVVVATTASLGDMSVEEYGHRVFNEWHIGKAAADNGVLVLVAPTERQMRIEVGYGLEGVLPDVLAGAIIRDDVVPHFRDGNYEAGILAGVRRVADVIRARQVVAPEQLVPVESASASSSSSRPGVLGSDPVRHGRRDVVGRGRDGRDDVRPRIECALRAKSCLWGLCRGHIRRPANLVSAAGSLRARPGCAGRRSVLGVSPPATEGWGVTQRVVLRVGLECSPPDRRTPIRARQAPIRARRAATRATAEGLVRRGRRQRIVVTTATAGEWWRAPERSRPRATTRRAPRSLDLTVLSPSSSTVMPRAARWVGQTVRPATPWSGCALTVANHTDALPAVTTPIWRPRSCGARSTRCASRRGP